ncbi:hypothetical protein [Nannocystis pusilla]|uniref:hypothetical protein n=1 Tax=Nannocystis pusilla TaxID=889268 RepID=UPI003DA45224
MDSRTRKRASSSTSIPATSRRPGRSNVLLTRLHQPVDAAVQLEDGYESLHERLAATGDDDMRARLDVLRARLALVAEHYRAQGKLTALARLSVGE